MTGKWTDCRCHSLARHRHLTWILSSVTLQSLAQSPDTVRPRTAQSDGPYSVSGFDVRQIFSTRLRSKNHAQGCLMAVPLASPCQRDFRGSHFVWSRTRDRTRALQEIVQGVKDPEIIYAIMGRSSKRTKLPCSGQSENTPAIPSLIFALSLDSDPRGPDLGRGCRNRGISNCDHGHT